MSRSIAVATGLVLAAAAFAPAEAARAPSATAAQVVPLFDPLTRFKMNKSVKLLFRARGRIGAEEIAFSLRNPGGKTAVPLPARKLKGGAFEVPFTPTGPGQYAVFVAVRGGAEVPAARLGVPGVVNGLVEEPPEADLELKPQKRTGGHTRR